MGCWVVLGIEHHVDSSPHGFSHILCKHTTYLFHLFKNGIQHFEPLWDDSNVKILASIFHQFCYQVSTLHIDPMNPQTQRRPRWQGLTGMLTPSQGRFKGLLGTLICTAKGRSYMTTAEHIGDITFVICLTYIFGIHTCVFHPFTLLDVSSSKYVGIVFL